MKNSPFVRFASAIAISTAVVSFAPMALAQSDVRGPDLGTKRTLVIDELSGFRASTIGGISYAGPIGFSTQSLSEDLPAANAANAGTRTQHYTNVWLAPSADYFVINHLSVGGLLEIAHTGVSETDTVFNTSTTVQQPSHTYVTVLPRVGWMFGITERFGIWPRLGLGYTANTTSGPAAGTSDTFSAFVIDLDVGFVYRINDTFFISGRPEFTIAPGSHSVTADNVSTSLSASFFQFALTGGVGIMWGL